MNTQNNDTEVKKDASIDWVLARLKNRAEWLPNELQPDIDGMKNHYLQALVVDKVWAALFLKELNDVADSVDARSLELSESFKIQAWGMDAIVTFVQATLKKQEEISIWVVQWTHTMADFDALEAERSEFFAQHSKASV